MKKKIFLISIFCLITTLMSVQASAVPAFARKYNKTCASCHTAWPQLNTAGREFKEAGYRFKEVKGEKAVSDFLNWDRYFPVSAVIKARPFDKKDSGDRKIRAIHEIELMVAGSLSKSVSGFFEIEAEDEDTNSRGFETGIPEAVLTYSHNQALNAQLGWGSISFADPYDTYADSRRLTRGHNSVVDQKFDGADNGGRLRSSRQTIAVYGRVLKNKLYYTLGLAGDASDSEGQNGDSIYARLATDVVSNITVGLMALNGTCKAEDSLADNCGDPGIDRDYQRFALDAQADIGNFRVLAVFLQAEDDTADGLSEGENDAWYLQGQYVFTENGRPTFVPLIRFDNYENSDGTKDAKEYTINVGYYFTENIKGYIEYWDRYDATDSDDEDSRITLQVESAF